MKTGAENIITNDTVSVLKKGRRISHIHPKSKDETHPVAAELEPDTSLDTTKCAVEKNTLFDKKTTETTHIWPDVAKEAAHCNGISCVNPPWDTRRAEKACKKPDIKETASPKGAP